MIRTLFSRAAIALLAIAVATASAKAQGSRADLLRQAQAAYDDFDAPRAMRLARTALDPALGARDTTWARGVHLLTQLLIEDNQTVAARTWARWAMRIEPTMAIDSVNFLEGVVTALREARASAVRTTADDATRETYAWPVATSTSTESRIRLASGVNANVLIRGAGLLTAGPGITLDPGTYELEVTASGFLPMRLTREVLPGVTTELSFTLTSAAAAANTLAADVRTRVQRSIVPLSITRFGATTAACGVGAVAAGGRLVVTTYSAVRGADNITSGAAVGDAIRIAAYDKDLNLAVLVVPSANTDTLAATSALVDGQALFGLTLTNCATVSESRVVLNSWTNRPSGDFVLSAAPANAVEGTPFVDYLGNFAGVWTAGTAAHPASAVSALLARARTAVTSNQLLAPLAVATTENHRYGTLQIATDVDSATIRVTPLEAWHRESDGATGRGPLTFNGPAGRYRVTVSAPSMTERSQDVTVLAGQRGRQAISLRTVAQAPGQAVQPRRGGMPRWAWYAVIGGGAVAALALGGGGGGGPSTGIDISFPHPTP